MLKIFLYTQWLKIKKSQFISERKREGTIISNKAIGYLNVEFEGSNIVPEFCNFSGHIKLGKKTTLGVHNFIFGDIEIGKYCQLGAFVALHGTNHPTQFLTTYINKNLFGGELSGLKDSKPIIVGNDVWIGHGAIILGGVNVGHGAVIGAGSVVTKDVSPYTIVAGNPARPIRKRFTEAIIQELLDLNWWDMSEEELNNSKKLFYQNLTQKKSIKDV